MTQAVSAIRGKLERGEPVMGLWSIIPSAALVETLVLGGLDFIILDMEHGAYDFGSLDNCIRACESAGGVPLVRPPGPDPFVVQKVLDLGAHGVLIPQIPNSASAREAIRTTKYAPDGCRGFNPFTRAANYCPPPRIPAGKLDNRFGFNGIIVETEGANAELEAILALPGLDWVYLGAYDMSIALGCAGDTKSPKVQEFLHSATQRARAANKVVGVMVKSQDEITQALAMGAKALVFGVDTFLINRAAAQAVELMDTAQRAVASRS